MTLSSFCAALNSQRRACGGRTKENLKWCPRHDEERKKLYAGYKAHHAALDSFSNEKLCHNAKVIQSCCSFEIVKGWSKALNAKYRLLSRCIQARSYFTERFFGNDMDFGHKKFWQSLVKRRCEIEALLEHVERRAYELILTSQNALWVLAEVNLGEDEEDCSGHAKVPLTKAVPSTPKSIDLCDIEDPIDVALREKRVELQEKIWTQLAQYCAPRMSIYYRERLNVIWACVRRAIYTDAALMITAQNYKHPAALLGADLDLTTVEKLWHAVKHLSPHDAYAAVDDVLRPQNDKEDYILVLGARVYRNRSLKDFPFHAWGHMTAIFMCYSCVRRSCKTVDDIVALTRFVVLNGGGLSQSYPRYDFGYDSARALVLCGFIPNDILTLGPRFQVDKCNCSYDHNTAHWSETKISLVLCAGLSLKDPKAQLFVNACLRHPGLMVLVRKGANGRIVRSRELWVSKSRHASTRAGLSKVPWEYSQVTVPFRDSLLERSKPLISRVEDPIPDCFQVALADGGDGDMEEFMDKVVKVWYSVYGVNDLHGLLSILFTPYIDSNELELHKSGGYSPLVPNLESNVFESLKRLKSFGSRSKAGRLVDDEIMMDVYLD